MFGRKADSQVEPAAALAVAPGLDDFEARLGDLMRGERATKGKSLLDVQRDLRIRAAHIAAIENCDISAFDTPSFVAGYVRSYARYLDMDPEETFRRFCAESGFQPLHGLGPVASAARPAARGEVGGLGPRGRALYLPQPESFWSGIEPRAIGSLLVLLVLVCGLGFGGWAVLQEVQKVSLGPVEDVPGVIATLDPAQDIGEAPAEAVAIALPRPDLPDPTFRPQLLEAPELPARDSPIAAIDPNLPRPVAPPPAATAAPVPGDARQAMGYGPQLPAAAGPQGAPVLADAGPGVTILAARPAWVRVTAADGTVLLEKTMDAGERFALPALEAAPMLRAGNSGAVYFTVDGRTYGPAAPGAQVVKQVVLSPEALVERFPLADPSKDSDLAQMVLVASAEAGTAPAAAN